MTHEGIALLLAGLVVLLIGVGVRQAFRRQDRTPSTPKELFLNYLIENLGLDPMRLDASTFLLSGPMADELDITEVFHDLEEMFGIELTDAETAKVETVGELWELVERKSRP
jgi:acyl carrier protein